MQIRQAAQIFYQRKMQRNTQFLVARRGTGP